MHRLFVSPGKGGNPERLVSRGRNVSIRVKAFAASLVLLVCLLGLGGNAYLTSTHSLDNLRRLSNELVPKQQAFGDAKDAVTAAHLKIFRYVSWSSNSV